MTSKKFIYSLLCLSAVSYLSASEDNVENPISLYADFLYLKRNYIHSQKIAIEADLPSKNTMLTTEVLVNELGWQPGIRGGVRGEINEKFALDANFIYVATWHGQSARGLADEVSFPFDDYDYTNDFYQADSVIADYKSRFRQIELNTIYSLTPRWENYFSVTTVFGIKAMFIYEDCNIAYYNPPDISHYDISTSNIVTSAQAGFNFQVRPYEVFAMDLSIKGGIGLTYAKQKTFLGDDNDLIVLRDFDTKGYEMAATGEAYGKFTYRPNPHLELYAGYLFIFATGVALAPEQIDTNTDVDSGKNLYSHGNYINSGAVVGININF